MIDGNKFIEMGLKFKVVHRIQNLTSENLDFCEGYLTETPCGTVACHGGWGCVLFDITGDYEAGGNAIAKFLGFYDMEQFQDWAADNPEFWGNDYGEDMFYANGYQAFGFEEFDEVTVDDIGDHHIAVGKRLIA